MKKLRVLSLFDGISCGRVALERAGFEIETYYASEIDEYAIKVAMSNYPDIIQIGDVTKVNGINYKNIDLLIGGSPCQDLSSCHIGEGLDGQKSGLFFEYLRILHEVKPKYFLLENVVPRKKEDQDKMTELIGVEPIFINSSEFSAQNRPRLYWTNIPFLKEYPNSNEIVLDILEDKESFTYERPNWLNNKWGTKTRFDQLFDCYGKASCLTATMWKGQKASYTKDNNGRVHKFTPIECERLQALPDNYTSCLCNTKRYQCIGNGWTVDVIAHIFKGLKAELDNE